MNDEEFREFVRSRAARLHRTAYLLCGDWHLADDLVQETLAKCFRHWPRVSRSDSPDSYVRRMLVNEAHNHFRRHRRAAVPIDISRLEANVPDPVDGLLDRAALLRALLALSARQRATIVLRYLEGLSERETAAILNCSEGTVKSQASRGLSALKAIFEREEARL
jgi:RNA polymerase sigma-70 factor (sigma-E family)